MKRAIIAGLIILVLFGAGEHARLVAIVDAPNESFELASTRITCSDTRAVLEVDYGARHHCLERCALDPDADGRYALRTGITPELTCIGPRGTQAIPGTGVFETIPLSFCADEHCLRIVDYCDCHAPNITLPQSNHWYSEPFVIELTASDNHNLSRIETPTLHRCTGENCTVNITVPIARACSTTGTGTCAIYANATDQWEHTAEAVALYNVDLNPPELSYEWLSDGLWHADRVSIAFTAREPTADESGVAAIYIETRNDGECSQPGSNYTRYPTDRAERHVEESGTGVFFCAYATDRAIPANRGAIVQTQTRYADTTPPTITLSPQSGWYDENQILRIGCHDEQSGCAAYGHLITNGTCPSEPGAYRSAPITTQCPHGASCTYEVCGWAVDRVGREARVSQTINIDTSPPTIEVVSTHRTAESITIELLLSDEGSGLDTCSIEADETVACEADGFVTSTSVTVSCSEPCTYTIRVRDRAGNAVEQSI